MKKIIQFFGAAAVLAAAIEVFAFSTPGFLNPYGVVVDQKTNYIYVSNVNGDMSERDDNGFISRLKGDGAVDNLKFIDGSVKEIDLHAPKGMTVVGTTLYVADIDKLHAFDLQTGKLLFDVNFGNLPVQHFFDISTGPDEALYVSDGPGNTIYRVDVPRLHEVTTLVSGELLGFPHGISWYPARQLFVVAGSASGQAKAFDRAGKHEAVPSIFLKNPEGIAADDSGNLYIASTALSSVFKIGPNFALASFGLGIDSPAGVAYNRAAKQILTASFNSGTVQSISIEAPSQIEPLVKKIVQTTEWSGGQQLETKPEIPVETAKEAEAAAGLSGAKADAKAEGQETQPVDAKTEAQKETPPMAGVPSAPPPLPPAPPPNPSHAAPPSGTSQPAPLQNHR